MLKNWWNKFFKQNLETFWENFTREQKVEGETEIEIELEKKASMGLLMGNQNPEGCGIKKQKQPNYVPLL